MSQDSPEYDFDLDDLLSDLDLDDSTDETSSKEKEETSQPEEVITKIDKEIEEMLNSLDSDRALKKAKESFSLDEFADIL